MLCIYDSPFILGIMTRVVITLMVVCSWDTCPKGWQQVCCVCARAHVYVPQKYHLFTYIHSSTQFSNTITSPFIAIVYRVIACGLHWKFQFHWTPTSNQHYCENMSQCKIYHTSQYLLQVLVVWGKPCYFNTYGIAIVKC